MLVRGNGARRVMEASEADYLAAAKAQNLALHTPAGTFSHQARVNLLTTATVRHTPETTNKHRHPEGRPALSIFSASARYLRRVDCKLQSWVRTPFVRRGSPGRRHLPLALRRAVAPQLSKIQRLIASLIAPKSKTQKMSLGDFLGDQCTRHLFPGGNDAVY